MAHKKLFRYMKEQGLKQKQLAYILGISNSMTSQLLSGKRNPSLKLAWKIQKFTYGKVPPEMWIRK